MNLFISSFSTQATAGNWDLTSYQGKLDPTHFYMEGANVFFFYVFFIFSGLKPRVNAVFLN
jgi:hypothetical protein